MTLTGENWVTLYTGPVRSLALPSRPSPPLPLHPTISLCDLQG